MHKLLATILCIGLLLSNFTNAEVPTAKEHCTTASGIAEKVMALRQYETSISIPLKTSQQFADDETVSGIKTNEFMDSVIIDAYSHPLRYSERMKKVSINEFAAKYYLECMTPTD